MQGQGHSGSSPVAALALGPGQAEVLGQGQCLQAPPPHPPSVQAQPRDPTGPASPPCRTIGLHLREWVVVVAAEPPGQVALGTEEAERPELEGASVAGQEPAAQALRLRLAPPAPLCPSLDVTREPPTLSASARLSSPHTTPQPSPPSPGSPPRRPGLLFSRFAEGHWQEALCRILEGLGRPACSRRTLPPQLPSLRNQPVTNHPPRDHWSPHLCLGVPSLLGSRTFGEKGTERPDTHPNRANVPHHSPAFPPQDTLIPIPTEQPHPIPHTHRGLIYSYTKQDTQHTSQPQAPHIPTHRHTAHQSLNPHNSLHTCHPLPGQNTNIYHPLVRSAHF